MNIDTKQIVADTIYNYIDYMYCDTCRFHTEIDCSTPESLYNPCEDCHRKYNGWAIAKHTAEDLADRIIKAIG